MARLGGKDRGLFQRKGSRIGGYAGSTTLGTITKKKEQQGQQAHL